MLSACGAHITMNGNNTSSMLMQTPEAGLLRVGTGTRKNASAAVMCYKTDQIQVNQGYTNTRHNVLQGN